MEKLDNKLYSLCEAVADIATMFTNPKLEGQLPEDSREVVQLSIEWAQEFEEKNDGREWDGEYMDEIEEHFEAKFTEWTNRPRGKMAVWRQVSNARTPEVVERLEYLRGELEAECISLSELQELQSLAKFIEPGDVRLLEAAGVPEHAPASSASLEMFRSAAAKAFKDTPPFESYITPS